MQMGSAAFPLPVPARVFSLVENCPHKYELYFPFEKNKALETALKTKFKSKLRRSSDDGEI